MMEKHVGGGLPQLDMDMARAECLREGVEA